MFQVDKTAKLTAFGIFSKRFRFTAMALSENAVIDSAAHAQLMARQRNRPTVIWRDQRKGRTWWMFKESIYIENLGLEESEVKTRLVERAKRNRARQARTKSSGGNSRTTPTSVGEQKEFVFSSDPVANAVIKELQDEVRKIMTPKVCSGGVGSLPRRDLDAFLATLENYASRYPDNQLIRSYCMSWSADACLAAGDWPRSWRFLTLRGFITLSEVVNQLPKAKARMTGADLMAVLRSASRLTAVAKEHPEEIEAAVQSVLDDYYAEHGLDPILRVHSMFDYDDIDEGALTKLESLYDRHKSFQTLAKGQAVSAERRASFAKDNPEKTSSLYNSIYWLFPGAMSRTIQVQPWTNIPTIIQGAMNDEARRVLREGENLWREERGLPNVGEGWVRETELVHRVREAWPNLRVVHHGRPAWLGRQHLDIWLPEVAVALEYQGAQHNTPVAFFGGEEGFLEAQKRDRRKAKLCRENGCHLICVEEGYAWPMLREEIHAAISRR